MTHSDYFRALEFARDEVRELAAAIAGEMHAARTRPHGELAPNTDRIVAELARAVNVLRALALAGPPPHDDSGL